MDGPFLERSILPTPTQTRPFTISDHKIGEVVRVFSAVLTVDPPRVYYGGEGVEHPGQTLAEFTLQHLQHFAKQGDRAPPAQVDTETGRAVSYGWLLERSVQAAEGWRALGLAVGDTVAVCCSNSHELFPAVLGAMFNGCTVAAIVPSSSTEELLESLLLVGPRGLLSDANTTARMAAAAETLRQQQKTLLRHVVLVAEGEHGAAAATVAGAVTSAELFLKGAALRQRDGADYVPPTIGDPKQHAAYILFSSGTTGKPKAVVTSDYSLLIHSLNPGSWVVLEGERFLVSSPLSWISGALMMFQCAFVGATRVFLRACNDEHTWLRTIHKYKINLTFAPPWLLSLVPGALVGSEYDVSSLRAVSTGGAAFGADIQARLQAALGCPVAQGYGCTEAGVAFSDTTGLPGQSHPQPGSLGRLQPWVHLRLVDPVSGRDVSEGELRYKTPYLMLGYVGDPKASAQGFDEHGFYCTGDLVRRSSDGYYYFVDRIKELMKYNSWPISASELEEVLLLHPLVREACVLGRPHPIHGDLPTAFVVRAYENNNDPTDEQLREEINQLVRARLSDHKLLRGGIHFENEIPKTSSGKVDRKKLKEKLVSIEVEIAKVDSKVIDKCVYLKDFH